MKIRTVQLKDYLQIDALIRESFTHSEHGYGHEAELVNAIRKEPTYNPDLEIVATKGETIVGHGLLSEVTVPTESEFTTGLVLAPLTVLRPEQKQGIGSSIIIELEQRAINLNYPFINILGSPIYYRRFGYEPAEIYKIQAPFTVPKGTFMIKPLFSEILTSVHGILKYSPAFD